MLLRRSHVLRNAGIAVALVACATSFLLHGDLRLMWFIGLGGTGVFLALMGVDGSVRQVRASLDAAGVHVGGRVIAPRRTIRSGWVEQSLEGSRVRLHRGLRPDVELEAANDAEAATVLHALACDPSQTVVRFPSVHRFFTFALTAGMAGQLCGHELLRGGGHLSWAQYLLTVAICSLWSLILFVVGPYEMSVGVDGVLVWGILRNRFIPFAEIDDAVVESAGKLVVRTRTSRKVVFRMPAPAAEAAAELIQSAITSSHSGSEAVRLQLRRQHEREGDVGAWLARLRSLASHEPYRATAFGGDALWRVVDDRLATGAERAAAAVVLGAAATSAERARLRDAAARMASPRVRVAIQRVADPAGRAGEEELAVAMEAIATESVA